MPTEVLPQYSNGHLIEVNCGFQFLDETIEWDSTFFGIYYEKIKSLGFTEKQQRKGVQIKFEGNLINTEKSPVTTSQVEDQVVFINNEKGWAIVMGRNKISFHIVKGYTVWNDFVEQLIKPFSKLYKDIGLGNGPHQCNVVYLNNFKKPSNEKLSDYFTIISTLDEKFGLETNTFVQRIISNKENLLITKLNSLAINDELNINLECGGICLNEECMSNSDWIHQANLTHGPIKNFFEAIITDKLRKQL